MIIGPDSLCSGESTFLDLVVSGGQGPYSIVSSLGSIDDFEIGTYTFTVTDDNNCSLDFVKVITEASEAGCISSTNEEISERIKFAPNPFSNELYVLNSTQDNLIIYFFSITGQILGEDVLSPGINELNLGNIKPGVLISRVQNQRGEILSVGRLIKME